MLKTIFNGTMLMFLFESLFYTRSKILRLKSKKNNFPLKNKAKSRQKQAE